jgi:ubiquinone/menaquinone biosynthesis C-methylase UbiE
MFGPSDSELGVLRDVAGKDVIELGCGTAYFGAWLARRGARVTGIDLTPAQLETARRMSEETGIAMELLEANAEDVPLPDASFDLAISEYGVDSGGGSAVAPGRRARLPLQLAALSPLLT